VVARVVTDVAGIDKEFDYRVPAGWPQPPEPGAQVRVELHGRRVGAWVTSTYEATGLEMPLRPLAKWRGFGPPADLVDLAGWAAWRWAGRRASFLTAASADHAVGRLPPAATRPPARPERAPLEALSAPGVHVVRLPPAADPTALVAAAAQAGPTLVVVPTAARAAVLAARLARAGGDVALVPRNWPQARAGAAVVVGPRGAAWAPCPGLAAVVVIDAHDEGLTQEGAPTWNAVAVAVERARRDGIPCHLVSSCPTPELTALGPVVIPDRSQERAGWATVEVVDRRHEDPRHGLYSGRLVRLVQGPGRVACVLNRTGRIRLLACAVCQELARCEACGAALRQGEAGLGCPRCGRSRPVVCAACGSTRLKALRIGTARARVDLERLAGRPVGEVNAATRDLPGTDVLVGTEAVLRRLDPSWGLTAVAFLDFDQELLAPRVRAASEALALLALASRLLRGRAGRIVVQTRVPDHPVVVAASRSDPALAEDVELRRSLGFPPFGAVAVVHGSAAAAYAAQLAPPLQVLGPDRDQWLVKAADPATLADGLAAVPRPAAGTLRIAVDPARL
jgi:primosomal protein N' (replication factor Y)